VTATPAARILVVDDDPQIRHMLATALGDEGHEVREAGHGVDGLALVRSWRPDIVILDLMMPTMNGWQFAEAYGAQPGPHAPVIVITAAGPGAIQSAEHLGTISAVLAKPLNLAELHEIIALHLGRRQ
jgi:CheY-like chemotaxis protein